jgi:hypothetical protein
MSFNYDPSAPSLEDAVNELCTPDMSSHPIPSALSPEEEVAGEIRMHWAIRPALMDANYAVNLDEDASAKLNSERNTRVNDYTRIGELLNTEASSIHARTQDLLSRLLSSTYMKDLSRMQYVKALRDAHVMANNSLMSSRNLTDENNAFIDSARVGYRFSIKGELLASVMLLYRRQANIAHDINHR